jgi:hypothetical protein
MSRAAYHVMASVGVACLLACGDSNGPGDTPPDVPPEATLVMDFADFQAQVNPAVAARDAAVGLNWAWSATVVGVWNLALTVTMATPVAAFIAAINQTPQANDGAWVWSYNFQVLAVSHSARLEARPATNGIDWDMFITRSGSFTDFNWFEGFSNLAGTTGTWSLRLNPTDPTPFIDIEWNRDTSGSTGDIRYTNVIPGNPENGAYIFAGRTGTTPYDSFYDIYGAAADNLTEIEWNRTTKVGRVRDANHFGNTDWHCWDNQFNDAVCP